MILREIVLTPTLQATQVHIQVLPTSLEASLAQNSDYFLRRIDGLDVDGMVYTNNNYIVSSTTGDMLETALPVYTDRKLELTLGYNPRETAPIEILRNKLYRLASTSKYSDLNVRFNGQHQVNTSVGGVSYVTADCDVYGKITRLDTDRFSLNPEITLTIDCDRDSMFRSVYEQSVSIRDVTSLTFSDDFSTAWHGCHVAVKVTSTVNSGVLTPIQNFALSAAMVSSTVTNAFLPQDVINIIHTPFLRSVYLKRGTATIPLGQALTSGVVWPVIYPGSNTWVRDSRVDWVSIMYNNAYWSI